MNVYVSPGLTSPSVNRPVPSEVSESFFGSVRPASQTSMMVPTLTAMNGLFSLLVTVTLLPSATAEIFSSMTEPYENVALAGSAL